MYSNGSRPSVVGPLLHVAPGGGPVADRPFHPRWSIESASHAEPGRVFVRSQLSSTPTVYPPPTVGFAGGRRRFAGCLSAPHEFEHVSPIVTFEQPRPPRWSLYARPPVPWDMPYKGY